MSHRFPRWLHTVVYPEAPLRRHLHSAQPGRQHRVSGFSRRHRLGRNGLRSPVRAARHQYEQRRDGGDARSRVAGRAHGDGRGGKVLTARQAPSALRRPARGPPLALEAALQPTSWGSLHAIDTATGEVRWEVPLGTLRDLTRVPTPARWGAVNLGGSLITGGLVFIAATPDRTLRAFDLATRRARAGRARCPRPLKPHP